MKKLIVIRHAKSSWEDPSLRDFDRPLNKRGKKDAPRMAALLSAKIAQPDQLLSSPANRAYSTCLFFAHEFNMQAADIIQDPGIYEASVSFFHQRIFSLEPEWDTVLMFGHNPTITEYINLFTDDYIPNVPTCGICILEGTASWKDFQPGKVKLSDHYFPKEVF